MLSLIIPTFNEEQAVKNVVTEVHAILLSLGSEFEIIIVNDGSTDGTASYLSTISLPHIKIVHHNTNRGNGAAIKTGIRHSKGELLGTIDADGTYPIDRYPDLIKTAVESDADMVVGSRRISSTNSSIGNRIGKGILTRIAIHMTQMSIPDINSGMRIMKRELALRFVHLFPDGFSSHITITLASLTNGYRVEFVPIEYYDRIGQSKLSGGINGPLHFVRFVCIIGRIILYFRPMRFFVAPSLLCIAIASVIFIYAFITQKVISTASLLLLLIGLQMLSFGLLADMVARHSQKN